MSGDDADDRRNDMADATSDDQSRDGKGRFTRDLVTADRDAKITRMRVRGMKPRDIAAELGVDESTVSRAIQRVLDETRQEPAAQMRQMQLEQLDDMYQAVLGVLERRHITVNNGRVIQLPNPVTGELEPLEDDGPVLQAVDRLLKIQARRAALLGLDAEAKAPAGVTLNYTIVGVDLDKL